MSASSQDEERVEHRLTRSTTEEARAGLVIVRLCGCVAGGGGIRGASRNTFPRRSSGPAVVARGRCGGDLRLAGLDAQQQAGWGRRWHSEFSTFSCVATAGNRVIMVLKRGISCLAAGDE